MVVVHPHHDPSLEINHMIKIEQPKRFAAIAIGGALCFYFLGVAGGLVFLAGTVVGSFSLER